MDQNEAVLTMKQVRVRRGSFLLQDIDLEVGRREIFAVLGKTGAGKSVLLETAAGFHTPERGEVFLHGQELQSLPIYKRNIGYLYQDYSLFPHMTARANIAFGLRMRRCGKEEIRQRVEETAAEFGIASLLDLYPGTLSGGEQQRVALARALITQPPLLLLDEPFSALDPMTRKSMQEMLLRVREDYDCAILFVTHDFEEAEHLADRIGILAEGRLRGVVRQSELYTADWEPEIKHFLGIKEGEA